MEQSVKVGIDGHIERWYLFEGKRIVVEHVYKEDTCYFAVNAKAAHELDCIEQVNALLNEYSMAIVREQSLLFVSVLDDDGNLAGEVLDGTKVAIDDWHTVIDHRAWVQQTRQLDPDGDYEYSEQSTQLMSEFCRGIAVCQNTFDFWFSYQNEYGIWDLNVYCAEGCNDIEPTIHKDETGSWCWVTASAYPVTIDPNGSTERQNSIFIELGKFRAYGLADSLLALEPVKLI